MTIYGTRESAAALYRVEDVRFSKNLYVVDIRQTAISRCSSKPWRKWATPKEKDCVHVSFGLMQIREATGDGYDHARGQMIPLGELLTNGRGRAQDRRRENPELSDEKASKVSRPWASKRSFIGCSRGAAALSSTGRRPPTQPATRPYLQYTHARSIPRKWRAANGPGWRHRGKLSALIISRKKQPSAKCSKFS
jgi:arginyl-tRNA synthetase